MSGALAGLRIIEIAAIGPAPFACMMLADHGAEVIRIERLSGPDIGLVSAPERDVLRRSRRRIAIDLKHPEGVDLVRRLIQDADGLVEGFRPGVMERLGLGPDRLLQLTPSLVFGRMSGWGQYGPFAHAAGHDINYISIAGALHAFGRAGERPTPPINLVGDFGGGGMLLAFGMVSALLHAIKTGEGQVIDCAMTDGSALLMSMIWSYRAEGKWSDERGTNLLDSGAPFYDTYETADGKYISIGALEPQFYELFVNTLRSRGFDGLDHQREEADWPRIKRKLQRIFRTLSRDEWCGLLEGSDVCFAPVLSLEEAPHHPHNLERETFIQAGGVTQPAPAPRFTRTPSVTPTMPSTKMETDDILEGLGLASRSIIELRQRGIVN